MAMGTPYMMHVLYRFSLAKKMGNLGITMFEQISTSPRDLRHLKTCRRGFPGVPVSLLQARPTATQCLNQVIHVCGHTKNSVVRCTIFIANRLYKCL